MDDVVMDSGRESLVVGVRGEIAIFEHPKPRVRFLGTVDQVLGEGPFQGRPWPPAFISLTFQIQLQRLPDDLEGELESLDCGVAYQGAFRLCHGLCKAGGACERVGLPFKESFPAHGGRE